MKAAPKLGLHGALCKCLVVHEKARAAKFAGLNAGHDGFLWVESGPGGCNPARAPNEKRAERRAMVENHRHAVLGVVMNRREDGLDLHNAIIARNQGAMQAVFRYPTKALALVQ